MTVEPSLRGEEGGITIDSLDPGVRYRQVNVWYADITKWEVLAPRLVEWLSPGERRRAEAFRFQADFAAYVVSHAMLRWLLARCIGISEPGDVVLRADRSGKPGLALPQALKGHRFSLSRSHSLAAVAMTRLGRVGIDVERSIGPERTLSEQRAQVSRREWVRRESVIKALGGRLDDINRYEVAGDSPVRVRAGGFGRRLEVHDLFIDAAYEVAVAVPPGWAPRLAGEWDWDHRTKPRSGSAPRLLDR